MSRQTFLADMSRVLETRVRGVPSLAQLRRYFRALTPDAALAAYQEYASSFYVHIATATGDPTADVTYPGGACDRWREVTGRRQSGGRRIIDCEGFAFIAYQLLHEAGFLQIGYQVFYLATRGQPTDWHLVAVLEYPGEGPDVYIGGPTVSRRASEEINRVYPRRGHNARTAPLGDTPVEAIDNMYHEEETGRAIELAPLGPRRRAVVPPVMSDD